MFRTARQQDQVTMRRSSAKLALLGILLVGAGGAGGFFAGKASGPAPERQRRAAMPATPQVAASSSQLPSVLHAALSSELRQRLDSCLQRQDTDAAHVPSDDPQVDDLTVEDHLQSARAEPREPLFAESNTPRLEQDLSEVGQRFDFRFDKLDCRSTRCTVELDWPSLAAARSAYKSGFSTAFTRSHCQHRMLFPDVVDEQARARTVLIATCESPRELAAVAADPAQK
jgi:hypothetical protein